MDNKLKKLLALTTSPNEHEAQAALLKYRARLMQIQEKERLEEEDRSKVKHPVEIRTDIIYSKTRHPWIGKLAELTARRHGCVTYQSKKKNGRNLTLYFHGYPENVKAAKEAFDFTYDLLLPYSCENSFDYCFGFLDSMELNYKRQDELAGQSGMMTITVPAEVQKRKDLIRREKTERSKVKDIDQYNRGRNNYNG